MTTTRRGATLVVLGVALLALTFALAPALSPQAQPDGGVGSPATDAPGTGNGSSAGTDTPTAGPPETLVGVQGFGSYSEDGYVALLEGRSVAWRVDTTGTYFDVDRLENGSVLAAYMERGYEECGPYDAPCARTGLRVFDGDTREIVYEWSMPVRHHTNSEIHDVDALPGGGFVVADMEHERVFVLRDGEITWEWSASERYDAPDDPTRTDWLHINDVDRIGDGRYLVSVRNANQLVVLEAGEGVVEVINEDEDGDGVGDPSVLNHQHNPQWLGDGAVLVADSESHRIVELHRTENGSWEPAWTLTRADGEALDWPRDADRLPDGTTLVTDTRNARLILVDESGETLWRKRFDYRTIPYESDRLPHAEASDVPRYATNASETVEPKDVSTVPVLTPATRLLSAAVRLPPWFGEGVLGSVLASMTLVVSGVVVRVADLRRG
jgi:hypothetical protein